MLSKLVSPKTKDKKVQRGRGIGSHRGGHTAGRGTKGQKSRSGYTAPRRIFEGGSMTIVRRLPKYRGFTRAGLKVKENAAVLNLSDLNVLENNTTVTLETLREAGLIRFKSHNLTLKILAKGKLEKKLNIEGIALSEKAAKEIQSMGGSVK